ncbi:MAG: isoleucine--tRNA ligase [Spirochaetaceae bacterium]|jgi:isoleucyl-tRNA synthetase|nr:isoleucine--tRNA ligase [Spirochaetaceae bacterium]
MYQPVDPKTSFPALEEQILALWEKHDTFRASVENRAAAPEFVIYDGPPFANGLPHFGHLVPSTIKDIIPRYQTMRGKRVERRFGWDCHGLPVENLIEKELRLNSKTGIESYGVARFNDACRASVLRYVGEWRRIITRLGRWVDFDHDYKTMESDYMESIWHVMRTLWDRGLLYEGHYILPYCPRCATVLSNHELNLGGYQDVHDPAITIRFKVRENNTRGEVSPSLQTPLQSAPPPSAWSSATPSPRGSAPKTPAHQDAGRSPVTITPPIPTQSGAKACDTYLLAWTTTPWTLPSNLALTVGPDIDYVLIEENAPEPVRYILAAARLSAYYKDPASYKVLWTKKGAELAGMEYDPLFSYFAETRAQNAFRVYTGDFVSTEDGTGIVHTAPGFGEDDNRVLQGTGIPSICPIDAECKFTACVSDYAGRFVKDCDRDIIDRLKAEGKLVRRDQILHAYPHCWRCGSPLIYRAVSSWFVNVQKIKQDMIDANQEIYWVPGHIKDGRFGKWLEGARDWAISRNRYWGNPLPIWKCPDCGKTICVGSRAELKERSGVELTDLHKQFVDEVTIPCECGSTMRRIPEVLDCWFESGAMPYAQSHYPFENKAFFEDHFPADFINEGLDQTRGWFYTLTVLAAALFKRPAFKNCVVSGLVLASDGKKMSKSLRNYTDPMDVVQKFGADALRLFLVHSPVVEAADLRYSDEGVAEVLKSIIIPLWNAYSFFVTYANIDKITPAAPPRAPANPLDKWILSAAQTLVKDVGAALDTYDLSKAVDPILTFIDGLNNWYIRRSRRRFWRSENDADKIEAYAALLFALKTLVKAACPFMPFITEAVWQNLRGDDEPESVHLCDFPKPEAARIDTDLEFKMAVVQKAVVLGRALRSQYNLKNRQPLASVTLVTRDPRERAALEEMTAVIREELNVKEARLSDNESGLVDYEARANFRILGKELGKDMKAAAAAIEALPAAAIASLLEGRPVVISIETAPAEGAGTENAKRDITLTKDKLDIRRIEKDRLKVLNEGSLTVGLDTELTPALIREGDARDLIRGVQNLRKESGLAVTDRIRLTVHGSPGLQAAWDDFKPLICAEVLALQSAWEKAGGMTAIEAGDKTWEARIARAPQGPSLGAA